MLESKLLPGRVFEFTRPAWREVHGCTAAFITVACPTLSIAESTRMNPGASYNPFRNVGGTRVSKVAEGRNAAKVHRNFKWLPWYQGDISETLLDEDVLTGPMSGCILTSYKRGGQTYVAHVGTVTVTEAIPASINTNVKATWNAFATAYVGNDIRGFNPVARAVPAHGPAKTWKETTDEGVEQQHGDEGGETWGLFTKSGQFFAVNVWAQRRTKGPAEQLRYRVAGIHRVNSMTRAELNTI